VEAEIAKSRGAPRGHLHINTSNGFGVHQLASALPDFLALYPDWSIHILDRQTGTVINGPITCSYPPFDPTSPDPLISDPTRCVTGGYFTITPSGNHIVAYGTSLGDIALVYTVTLNQSCNPNCGSIASTHYTTWDLCGDHAAFASATDGNDYMVVFNCYDAIEVRVRNIALVSGGLSEEKTNSRLIFTMSGTDEVHFTCSVTQHQNWCIVPSIFSVRAPIRSGDWPIIGRETLMARTTINSPRSASRGTGLV